MARPKSDDPKVAVTIRVRASVLARMGGAAFAGAVIEGLAEERYGVAPVVKAVRVDAPLLVRKAFNPQPKPSKK